MATENYLRNLDRIIDEKRQSVYVIQDKRALRDLARQFGAELIVGDEEKAPAEPKVSTKGVSKPPTPGGGGSGQHQDADGERYPHKYIKRFKSPRGNWIYVYANEGAKRTGFGGEPEQTPPPPPIGQKRAQVAAAVKDRAKMAGGKARKEAFNFHSWVRNSMNLPESTQQALKGAVEYLGGGAKGMQELARRHADWMTKNPHLTHPQDQAFAGEMLAREVMAAHQSGKPGLEAGSGDRSRYADRPGGFTHKDPSLRQPWQLTRQEFLARQKTDPSLKGQDYEKVLASAAERREYIPNHVLGQGEENDPDFTERVHDFKQNYLKDQKPEMSLSPETKEYISKFERLAGNLPKKFDGWVKGEIKREGDKYLIKGKTSGYNIDSYDVTDAGIYSHMMTADETIVLYHQYAEHLDHGREVLAQLHEHGIDCEYTVVKRGSAVAWDNNWPDEAEMTYRETGEKDDQGRPKRIGYSSDYILAFRPKDNKQAEDIAALLHEHAHAGEEKFGAQPHQAIHRSWYVPDVRASKKIDGYGRACLNIKSMGHQELCILTKHDFIKEGNREAPQSSDEANEGENADANYDTSFRREYVYVDQALRNVIKALRGYGQLGRGEIVIVQP